MSKNKESCGIKVSFIQDEERKQINGLKGLVVWAAKWWQDWLSEGNE